MADTKVCAKCGNDPPDTDKYFHAKLTQVGCELSSVCIYCTNHAKDIKQCSKCFTYYPATLEYFNRDKRGKYGIGQPCKNCITLKRLEKYK